MGFFHKFLGDRRSSTKVFYGGFREDSCHEESVPWLIFNLAYLEGSLVFFRVFHMLQRGSRSTDVDGFSLHLLLQCLFLSYYAASFTLGGTSVHLHFSGLPIDLWIMVLEPGVTEDHALLPEVGDGEEHPFGVGFIMEDYIYHFRDLSGFIRGTIHIEHRYGARDVLGANTLRTNKIFIYEIAGGSRVQKCFDRMYFASVSGTDLYKEDDRRSAGIEGVGGESSG